jgi:alkanesulfonate monooxygenase SsuD/methylene tetrahydromethanopterin reductase-like flavin-dependent oxidoreductase (luciferase family)
VKDRFPELRVIPRLAAGSASEVAAQIEEFRAAGYEGVVANFGTEPDRAVAAMQEFAERYR